MALELYQDVVIQCDLPEHGLKQGDVATLLDKVPHPEGREDGCVLEVFNAVGESIAVVIVPVSSVGPLRPEEILSVRLLHV